ncbi:M56 family metallopeptidase [Persicitalea jodogahamensis]|uniref:TonB C-terminal domain-containing protein n=1 Tax=Persicitalea jodogahamensis TaxID=402147 RepID=A0A8J3D8J7_9BACT|nr:M56 family metallopeptidase [Persicitalea jodogahamensis]GHB68678.1 hypothetical protein GCM10007390_22650 [Persicitalea jodogahamensis]
MNYLTQVNLYWVALYLCYALFLRRHTFLHWNRAYLLGSLVVAFALPLVQYPEAAPGIAMPPLPMWFEMSPASLAEVEVGSLEETDFAINYGIANEISQTETTPASAMPKLGWMDWLAVIYVLGVVFMAARLFRHLRGVASLFHKKTCLDMKNYLLYLLDDDAMGESTPGDTTGSFSFLNHIVISRRDYEYDFDTVLSHELAHVRQRHSWDILLVEVLRVFFWFNPVLIFYKKSLQQVHEYLADREVCEWDATHRDRYAEFMLSYALTRTPSAVLVNPFFKSSLLKDRIAMLYKNKNSNWSLGKYAAVALLIGFMSLLVASCNREANKDDEPTAAVTAQPILVEGVVLDKQGQPLPGAVIVVKGTQMGTTTTSQGEFRIMAPAGSELDFSFMGFKKASLEMREQGSVRVTLAEEKASETSLAERVSTETGRLQMDQRVEKALTSDYAEDSVFTVVDTQPKFPGGLKAMYKFIQDNIKYPAAARLAKVEGKVFLAFVVNADGSIQNIQVLKGMGFGTDEEAIRVVKNMPRWQPGAKEDGRKVNVKYNLPISFVLPKEKKEIGQAVLVEKDLPIVTVIRKPDANAEVDSLIGLKFRLPNSGEEFDKNFKVSIRGRGFIGSNEPLFVLDGVVSPIENPKYFNDISPNAIEKIEILKGEKATKLYGVRGSNGVVLVTTKQGAKNQQNVK